MGGSPLDTIRPPRSNGGGNAGNERFHRWEKGDGHTGKKGRAHFVCSPPIRYAIRLPLPCPFFFLDVMHPLFPRL